MEHELRLGLKSKIDETEAMWHMLNTMFKNIEREYRYVDAIVKSLEANGEQGEKHGIGAVTAACLEVKMRKVKVHKEEMEKMEEKNHSVEELEDEL